MDRKQAVQGILDEYDRGLITHAEISGKLLEVLVNTDIDAQLAGLSPDALDWVLWELRDAYAPIIGRDPSAYGIIEGVTVQPGEVEAYRLDLARREEHLRTIEVRFNPALVASPPITGARAISDRSRAPPPRSYRMRTRGSLGNEALAPHTEAMACVAPTRAV